MDKLLVPFAKASIGEEEIAAITDVLLSGWLTMGPRVCEFEKAFAHKVHAENAIAVNSATAGLHLALDVIGIGPGDKVITTPYTFASTVAVIHDCGAVPLFADIDPHTFNIDPNYIVRLIESNDNVKAIIPVHVAGMPCNMPVISEIARLYNLHVIEDAAHAFPSVCHEQVIGSISDFTVFSFYATKTITTGEGGMITTPHHQYAKIIRAKRLHGISMDAYDRTRSSRPWNYDINTQGYKYNMTDIAAAMGLEQLKKADEFWLKRQAIAMQYDAAFSNLAIELPAKAPLNGKHAWHLYMIKLMPEVNGLTRDAFMQAMYSRGIGVSVHFKPLHLMSYWSNQYRYAPSDFPSALAAYKNEVSLPIYPSMTQQQVDLVISAVNDILA